MLKITKKIKKKHKHKRGKGDDELFTPEELERYKQQQAEKAREQAEAAAAAAAESSADATGSAAEEEGASAEAGSDEWQRFKALTAGVDDILKKSQGDLGRIKETSYYKRKPPGPSEPDKRKPDRPAPPSRPAPPDSRWVGFEEGGAQPAVEPEEPEPAPPVEAHPQPFPEEPEEEEEEEEEEEDDGLFDTSYVDVVTSGEIKLAYVPDSPTEEPEDDDPFDTSIVDQVIKPTEIVTKDGKKKKLVSLGCAVDVLTGLLEKPIPIPVTVPGVKKRRVVPKDLLLKDDNATGLESPVFDEPAVAAKSLLDDEEEIPEDLPVDLPVVPVAAAVTTAAPTSEEPAEDDKSDLKNLVAEFDIISTSPIVDDVEDILPPAKPAVVAEEEDDEFASLAAESIAKSYDPFDTSAADVALGFEEEKKRVPDSPDVDILLRSESPAFDTTATIEKQHPQRPPPPRPKPPVSHETEDPFDTSYAENLVPGKVELQIIESEILGGVTATVEDDDDFDFDPRAGEEPKSRLSNVTIHISAPTQEPQEDYFPEPAPLTAAHRDLLEGSNTDLSNLVHDPIEPATELISNEEDYDPFDTSVVDVLAPGKAELKILEEELLTQPPQPAAVVTAVNHEEDDFDPRAGEVVSQVDDFNPRAEEVVSPSSRPDLLAEAAEVAQAHKPLTPLAQPESEPVDPFDTSIAENIAPGRAELRLIEKELVKEEDDDFNPRQPDPVPAVILPKPERPNLPDLLAGAETDEAPHKPLTPAYEEAPTLEIDPFDTSLVSPVLAPGPAELRQLESELQHLPAVERPPLPPLPRVEPPRVTQDLLSATEVCEAHRPLSPQQSIEEGDPFDTSFAGDLLPGRAELKLLEAELIGQ